MHWVIPALHASNELSSHIRKCQDGTTGSMMTLLKPQIHQNGPVLLGSLLQMPPRLLRACWAAPLILCSELDVSLIFLSVYCSYAGKLWDFKPVSLLCNCLREHFYSFFLLNNYSRFRRLKLWSSKKKKPLCFSFLSYCIFRLFWCWCLWCPEENSIIMQGLLLVLTWVPVGRVADEIMYISGLKCVATGF